MRHVGSVHFNVHVPACVKHEDKWFIASCPLLDVHSQGRSEKESLANLAEAVHLFIESCYLRGTLDEVLAQSGFAPAEESEIVNIENGHMIDVSLPLLARNHAQARAC